jgi:hypothetical protein
MLGIGDGGAITPLDRPRGNSTGGLQARFCAGRRWFASEVTPTTPLRLLPSPDRLGASDQAEADAAFGAGVNRALWSWARELISSLR